MEKHEADSIIALYYKKIFGFAICHLRSDAEELAAQILFEVYRSLLRQNNIENIDAYVYRIARNVYARYIDKNHEYSAAQNIDCLQIPADSSDPADNLATKEMYGILRREITYLSALRRRIIQLYYFDSKKIREISQLLNVPENTIKWHLSCSRKELKTGMEKIRTTGHLGSNPIRMSNFGHSGSNGSKGDTGDFLAKTITQNIAYAAYHEPRTVNEIAEELGINPIFVEDEVEYLEEYGFMDKLKNGKYRTNIYITWQSEENSRLCEKIDPKFARLAAEEICLPLIENLTAIPDFLRVPDDDINLVKWCLVCFLINRVCHGSFERLRKFAVKRPDGGEYIAFATLANEGKNEPDTPDIFYKCGDMWREKITNSVYWKSWQFDTYWSGRFGGWRDNLIEDYDKLFLWLSGELPDTPSNTEHIARLMEKGYLVTDKNGSRSCNIILCDSKKRWHEFISEPSSRAIDIAKEYGVSATEVMLIGQPQHMHELIKAMYLTPLTMIIPNILKCLIDMGALQIPNEKQKSGLCTMMFLSE